MLKTLDFSPPADDVPARFAEPRPNRDGSPLSFFEFWPGWLFYTPIVLYWIAKGIQFGDLSIASAANPRIETGGLCGESKAGILGQAGAAARRWIAPYALFTTGSAADRNEDPHLALAAMQRADIHFPVVLKPDVGCNGTGVKLISNESVLRRVLPSFPPHTHMMVQKLVDLPVEAGLFYIRESGACKGRISSVTYKEAPVLIGDGLATVEELVRRDRRTRLLPEIYLPRLANRLNEIPDAGERVQLVFAGNHCKGSIFLDGRRDVTAALEERLDQILGDIPEFHFGRIDVKAASTEALRRGEGFEIIEINGIGAEATHIWDRTTTLREAYRAQFEHYGAAFRIGVANRRRGWRTCGAFTLLRYWRRQKRLLASYPLND